MRTVHRLCTTVALALASASSIAQFVKGNEAVKVMPDGTKKVETPPSSSAASKTKPCLQECTEPFARPTTCRDSTYGSQKLSRLWIAKRGSTWLWCQYPDLGKKCVDMKARPPLNLPVSAVQ
jgi:hypothetical protein